MIPLPHGPRGRHPRRPSACTVALALDGVFLTLVVALVVAACAFGQRGGETLADNLVLAGFGLGAAAAALAGGALALVALVRGGREKNLAVPLSIGGMVLLFLIGELIAPH